jgi:hypothetical protein
VKLELLAPTERYLGGLTLHGTTMD